MIDLFFEGIESLALACSLVLLVPAVGVLALTHFSPRRGLIWFAATSAMAWLRFSAAWDFAPRGPGYMATGAVLVCLAYAAWRQKNAWIDLLAVVITSGLAIWTWVPCVGAELAKVLNSATREPFSQILPTSFFFAGLFTPVAIITAATIASPQLGRISTKPGFRLFGIGVVATVGLLVATSLFDDLATELAQLSSL